jgi:hypothetical protein
VPLTALLWLGGLPYRTLRDLFRPSSPPIATKQHV